jgi:hypothetical protein
MASGIEAYNALRRATRGLVVGSEFSVNIMDSCDLRKLKVDELVGQGFDEHFAEEVSSALLKGDFGPPGRRMGLQLKIDANAPPLIPEA